ncbi:hypothetical protein [Hymenobacter canadensis]|uniref:Transposase DDE domain-containing protein n=1 Tax=Hymenobacter canadensis TaxID=2999067 RepID=A0ABY7LPI8_9BACT|nr:hypothetical protein [Hymenobacter canadensis]WBA42334.1 hypothetical protein O3303_01975 [Hymenobacter canadensis]
MEYIIESKLGYRLETRRRSLKFQSQMVQIEKGFRGFAGAAAVRVWNTPSTKEPRNSAALLQEIHQRNPS